MPVVNKNLAFARAAKNDEFYTRYEDIQAEMRAYLSFNPDVFHDKCILLPCDDPAKSQFTRYFAEQFDTLGIRMLISTCYCGNAHGRFFIRERGVADKQGLLLGNGDFRSEEICHFRDIADYIITNPPFSLYKEFIPWVTKGAKKFIVVGNKNSITYKEVFPLIKANKLWSGATKWSGGMWFTTPEHDCVNVSSTWFTNIEHGKRHSLLQLATQRANLDNSKHKAIRENGYLSYDNYNAIEVPYTDAIPSDYDGVMGVPITFLEKYNPKQFCIVGTTESEGKGFSGGLWDASSGVAQPLINGKKVYKRFFIRWIREVSVL